MGILELITIIFIVLKVAEVIDWSWWLVFAPMYVYVVAFIAWLFFAIIATVTAVATGKQIRNKRK